MSNDPALATNGSHYRTREVARAVHDDGLAGSGSPWVRCVVEPQLTKRFTQDRMHPYFRTGPRSGASQRAGGRQRTADTRNGRVAETGPVPGGSGEDS